jgi:hypothetical protein
MPKDQKGERICKILELLDIEMKPLTLIDPELRSFIAQMQ